jgi:hypothetical protein
MILEEAMMAVAKAAPLQAAESLPLGLKARDLIKLLDK